MTKITTMVITITIVVIKITVIMKITMMITISNCGDEDNNCADQNNKERKHTKNSTESKVNNLSGWPKKYVKNRGFPRPRKIKQRQREELYLARSFVVKILGKEGKYIREHNWK